MCNRPAKALVLLSWGGSRGKWGAALAAARPGKGSLCKRCHLAGLPTCGPTLARAASDSP